MQILGHGMPQGSIVGPLIVHMLHRRTTRGMDDRGMVACVCMLMLQTAVLFSSLCYVQTISWDHIFRWNTGRNYVTANKVAVDCTTISWDHIARWDTSKNYVAKNKDPADCPGCDDECPQGWCWSRDQCQISNKIKPVCDPLCVGGCSGPGPKACFICSKFIINDECVDHCPVGTYEYLNRRCISEAECFSMTRLRKATKENKSVVAPDVNTFITFNNTCIDTCPAGYERSSDSKSCVVCPGGTCSKTCNGSLVENIVTAESLRGCTYINGSLEINIKMGKSKTISRELEENLGSIKEIKGGLKVVRSPPLVNLHFLKNLTTIHGEDGENFAINIMENQNLQELWDWDTKPNFKVLSNRIFFHYNPKLCMHHILKLIKIAGVKNVTNLEVSKESNGDKFPCDDLQTVDISVSHKTSTLIQIHIPFVEVLRFEVHYMKNPSSDVSMYEDLDQCSDDGWKTVDVSVDAHRTNYETQGLSVNLTDLEAYTLYAFYVSGYSTDKIVATSIIYRETTLPSTPSELLSVHVYSNSSSEIVLSWEPPLRFNGKFEEYEITWKLIDKDESLLSLRNYCEYPMTYESESVTVRPVLQEKHPNSLSCCNEIPLTIQKDGFEQLCINFDRKKVPSSFPDLERGQTCKSHFYNYIYHNVFKYDNSNEKTTKNQYMKKSTKLFKDDAILNKKKSSFILLQPKENVKHLRGNANNFTISNVKHFQDYIVTIKACRERHPVEIELDDVYRCSKTEIVVVRIQKDEVADLIADRIEHEVVNNTLRIWWNPPVQPNGLVLAFELQNRQTDLRTPKSVTYCVPFLEYFSNKNSYSVVNLEPGEYKFRIRTISQAGKGPYSDYISFSVPRSFFQLNLVVITLLNIILGSIIVLPICIYIYVYIYLQRKHKLENIVITSTWNTHYDNPLDQWELERDDIVFGGEIGFGTFGKVYDGVLRPNNIPCAIKTVSEYANIYERNTFLSEAAIMKSVSGAYHIVRLMGVVTRERPPLVVMELMDLGDLRTYLISLRGTDTMTGEIKVRIAAQIADGMCFMEAKKFVHRDLAARNCLINKELTVKVGDFGMTRDIYENDYYRKGDKGLLPIRWMAPESLKDGLFTSQSDIWSYGIVLWEIQTLGEQPYRGLSNEQVLREVMGGSLKLDIPLNTPDPLKILMRSCWRNKPSQRITFMHTVGLLEYHIDDEFKNVSYYHGEEACGIREGLPDYIDMWSAEDPLLSECIEDNMAGLSNLMKQPPHKSSLELRVFETYGPTDEDTDL
ncbi:hypothetical protein J6590_046441 [Homalodisca vitripennis]|nr:hypothetical protein J6590_046441 [Homalodisca vitripennis]